MKKLAQLFAIAVLCAATVFAVSAASKAFAGPFYKTTLTSVDGGGSQTVRLDAKNRYCVQAKYAETCFNLSYWDGGTGAALADGGLAGAIASLDCSQAFTVPSPQTAGTLRMYPFYCFDSATRTAIVAQNPDGGDTALKLFQEELNPPRY